MPSARKADGRLFCDVLDGRHSSSLRAECCCLVWPLYVPKGAVLI